MERVGCGDEEMGQKALSVEINQRAFGQLLLGDAKPPDMQDAAHGDLPELAKLLSVLDPPHGSFGLAAPF